jgi:L-fucono-1,5-lactonase
VADQTDQQQDGRSAPAASAPPSVPDHGPTIVDAHQHLWDPATGWYGWLTREPDVLQRRFVFDDAREDLDRLGVTGTVLVQAADREEDTEAMLAEARTNPRVLGVVGYVPLERPGRVAERLVELTADPLIVGIRNLIHDQPDPDWLLRPDVAEGLALLEASGLPFDLVAVLPRHLEHVDYLAEHFPRLTVVVDHLAKPPVGTDRREPWRTLMGRVAAHSGTVAKISGLYGVGDRPHATVDELRPWVEDVWELFGPSRLMVGSDWPVSEVAGGYASVTGSVLQVVREVGDGSAVDEVLSGTASRVYGLATPPR